MKKTSSNKTISTICYITASISYLFAAYLFFTQKTSLGCMWLCLASANMCLGSVWLRKSKEENKNDAEEPSDQGGGNTDSENNETNGKIG